jgi:hypothetical protein
MSVYTVHEPPLKGDETEPNPERFQLVRDGFHFWAFLLAPLWMLRYRLWLVLVLYILVNAALHIGLTFAGASGFVRPTASFLLAVLVGIEAASLRRWTLNRRGWRQVGVVVGDDFEAAEHRFFDAWVKDHGAAAHTPPGPAAFGAPAMRMAPHGSDVVGLFPEPGASR